jgi:hypothetical protein
VTVLSSVPHQNHSFVYHRSTPCWRWLQPTRPWTPCVSPSGCPHVHICLGSCVESADGSAGARQSYDFDNELRIEWSHFLLIHVNEYTLTNEPLLTKHNSILKKSCYSKKTPCLRSFIITKSSRGGSDPLLLVLWLPPSACCFRVGIERRGAFAVRHLGYSRIHHGARGPLVKHVKRES